MSTASPNPSDNQVVPNVRTSDASKSQRQSAALKLRPAADVFESESAYKIELDLVSVSRDEISISVERDTLKVSAPRRSDGADTGSKQPVVYERDFTLPSGVDRDGVTATYTAGVLGIVIPKPATEKPRRVTVTH